MQMVLGPIADQLGWETGFNQREAKLKGSVFVQSLVFTGMEDGRWSYTRLSIGTLDAGVKITPQGLEQRFTRASAALCQAVLAAAVGQVIQVQPAAPPLLERFAGVYVRDSSVISLPHALERIWAGSASSHGSSAGVKLQVRLELRSGQLAGPVLMPGRAHDSQSPYQSEDLPVGALRLGDLGFFSLKQFARDQARGVYWLSRYKTATCVYAENGQSIDLLAWLRQPHPEQFERAVYLGRREQLPCRLLVEHVPAQVVEQRRRKLQEYARKKQVPPSEELLALSEWTVLITNVPADLLSLPEALVLLAVRWQIELLFRLWKSQFLIDEWRSEKPWRILTELYAKLIGIVLLHWTLLVDRCPFPLRSIWKAALVVRSFARQFARTFRDPLAFQRLLADVRPYLQSLCHLNPRRKHPNTYQRLENPDCTTLP
jgi:hypothetical protein